jgi:hypothetical protein
MIILASVKKWWTVPQNRKVTYIVGGSILVLIILWVGIVKISNWLHDVNYQHQQDKDKTIANQAETNANLHEVNANVAANTRKELEQHEANINQQQADQKKKLDTDRKQSENTRANLNTALNTRLPDRNDNSGLDDDQLRSDSNAARSAFNGQ